MKFLGSLKSKLRSHSVEFSNSDEEISFHSSNQQSEERAGPEDVGEILEHRLQTRIGYFTEEIRTLRNKVSILEAELEKQRRLKLAFKARAGSLGDYLKLCLQALEDKELEARGLRSNSAADAPAKEYRNPAEEPETHGDERLRLLKEHAEEDGWYISETEIELRDQLGSGATCDTYRGIWHGSDVAVKCISPRFFEENQDAISGFCQELEMLSRMRHPNVVQFLGACLSPPDQAWIVMECLPGGTLQEWLHGEKARSHTRAKALPDLAQRLHVALLISKAMQYLHERKPKVIHRDLKPSNIFLDEFQNVRIADFGFARFLESGRACFTGETGTYVYMAPEVIRHEPYDETCDVYSFGVLLCELLTGAPPYIDTDLTPVEIAFAVAQGKLRPSLPCIISDILAVDDILIELVKSTWDQQPNNRPPFSNITSILKTLTTFIPF